MFWQLFRLIVAGQAIRQFKRNKYIINTNKTFNYNEKCKVNFDDGFCCN